MTKVVNIIDKVAERIENMDQLDKTAGVMGTVTSSSSLTKDAKVLYLQCCDAHVTPITGQINASVYA